MSDTPLIVPDVAKLAEARRIAERFPDSLIAWLVARLPAAPSDTLDVDVVAGLNDAARTLVEALDRHGIGNLAIFEQQVEHLRGHLLSAEFFAAYRRATPTAEETGE